MKNIKINKHQQKAINTVERMIQTIREKTDFTESDIRNIISEASIHNPKDFDDDVKICIKLLNDNLNKQGGYKKNDKR